MKTSHSDPESAKPLYTLDLLKQHTRYYNSAKKQLPSVTTILDIISKPQLLSWAHQCGLDGKDYRKVREEAANIGTIGHAMCEAYLRGMELDTSNLNPQHVATAETTFIKFMTWWDESGFEVLETECKLVSEQHQVGGTADIIARDPQDKVWLIDLKTSKGIYEDYYIQASAYADIWEECRLATIDNIAIVRIGKEEAGDFEVRKVFCRSEAMEVFIDALRLYRSKQRLGKITA